MLPAGGVLAQLAQLPIPGPLRFWEGFEAELTALALFSVGIAVYGLFIYFFYENLSRRNLLGDRFQNPGVGAGRAILRGLRYILVFPAVTFVFFLLLAFSFFFLSGRSGQAAFDQILLISMAVVTSVRITAYISEPTSHDIAKLLPLGLLGVYLVTFNLDVDVLESAIANFRRFLTVDVLAGIVARYFLFLLLLESVLRLIYLAVRPGKGQAAASEPSDRPGGGGGRGGGGGDRDRPVEAYFDRGRGKP